LRTEPKPGGFKHRHGRGNVSISLPLDKLAPPRPVVKAFAPPVIAAGEMMTRLGSPPAAVQNRTMIRNRLHGLHPSPTSHFGKEDELFRPFGVLPYLVSDLNTVASKVPRLSYRPYAKT